MKKKKSKKIIISASIRNVLVLPHPLPSFDKYWQAELKENPSLGELKNNATGKPIKAGTCYPCRYSIIHY